MRLSPIGFKRAALHLGALWALSFAGPLLRLLGDNAEFFVARDSPAPDIVVLAVGYALVPPLAGAGVVWGLSRRWSRLAWGVHLVLVAALVAALALPVAGRALPASAAAVAAALAVAAGGALAYARLDAVRAFVTALSPAPAVFVVLFLCFSPVSDLVLPRGGSGAVAGPSRSSTPIVHVVLDELPVTTLTDDRGRLDAELFPNLAELAAGATWYRNATTVADSTPDAITSQLTGRTPERGDVPTYHRHPRNLFTLFGRSHDTHAIEPITDLCPPALCAPADVPAAARLRALADDLGIVARHLLLPAGLRKGLPPIDRAWSGFGAHDREPEAVEDPDERRARLRESVLARLRGSDATAAFAAAGAVLERPRARPPLLFLHSTLPHAPWRRLPDGRQYVAHRTGYPGIGERWRRPQWLPDQSFRRHVLQVQYVDALVGRLLDRLRAAGLYDRAVVVVSADHGASFQAGALRRWVGRENLPEIAGVPLIVKAPHQREGRVDDRAVRSVDVLPTIARAAGVRVPWKTEGTPAAERRVDPAAPISVTRAGDPGTTLPLRAVLEARRRRDAYEGAMLRHGVYAAGPRPDLLGRPVRATPAPHPGLRATVDGPGDYADVRPGAPVVPVLVSGTAEGLRPDAVLAVAVDGRIAATTRVWPGPRRQQWAALVDPALLGPGEAVVDVLQVLPGDRLRRLGGTAGARTPTQ